MVPLQLLQQLGHAFATFGWLLLRFLRLAYSTLDHGRCLVLLENGIAKPMLKVLHLHTELVDSLKLLVRSVLGWLRFSYRPECTLTGSLPFNLFPLFKKPLLLLSEVLVKHL